MSQMSEEYLQSIDGLLSIRNLLFFDVAVVVCGLLGALLGLCLLDNHFRRPDSRDTRPADQAAGGCSVEHAAVRTRRSELGVGRLWHRPGRGAVFQDLAARVRTLGPSASTTFATRVVDTV